VSIKHDPEEPTHRDQETDRGNVSKEGFKDYDQEAHPKQVDIDSEEPEVKDRERTSAGSIGLQRPDPRNRFEVHFRMMKLRI
jgi:hypothetical protein